MLLTELILSKRGPLAKVWLSAHHEKKLSKQQALGVDVGESVEAILEQEDGPVTLRLSGQLMLGVTRIYSRKAQYLFEDCKETRENITRTFRPGVVDLPEDQQKSNNNAITLADTRNDFDFFDWSWSSALPPPPTSRESPGPSRQHLRAQTREYGAYNFGRIAAGSIYGGSTPSRQSHDGDNTSKLDSHDFSGIDLQLDIDNDIPAPNPEYGTPEVGRRDATPVSHRSFSQFRGGSRDKSVDIGPPETFEPIDLGLDLDLPTMPELDNRSRRASSALSTPPPASPPSGMNDITPRMAAKIAGFPERRDRSSPAVPKAKKARLVQADDALELEDDELAMNRDLSDILTVERYIPADPTITRMREIMDDPAGHFLPSLKLGGDSAFYVGPRDLAPELEELFTFPSNILRKRQDQSQQDERQSKRARTDEDVEEPVVEDDIEVGRRQSVLPTEQFELGGDDGYVGGDQTFDDIQPGFEDSGPSMEADKRRLRTPSVAPSVTETIARQIQEQRSSGTHDLAMFEKDARDEVQSQSQALTTPTKSVVSEPISKTSSGYSKNTGMAMGLLRREIEAIEEEDKVVGFDKLADKASKRAASAFFFELLVLGTRDAVKLDQREAFGDIEIRGKDKLFAEIMV